MLELLKPADPPNPVEIEHCRSVLKKFFAEKIHPVIDPVLLPAHPRTRLIGTGGAATILARMEFALDRYHRHAIDGAEMPLASIERWMEKLWSMTLRERKQIVGLPKKRADVILTGLAIYEAVLKEFGFSHFQASTRGLRFAAVMDGEEATVGTAL
jgi:exopolyphosphatase/guanosine-5'-triphosphate,3'-diphosphate pyrophosphatase